MMVIFQDLDGTIVFNYSSNRIECNLERKYNEYEI